MSTASLEEIRAVLELCKQHRKKPCLFNNVSGKSGVTRFESCLCKICYFLQLMSCRNEQALFALFCFLVSFVLPIHLALPSTAFLAHQFILRSLPSVLSCSLAVRQGGNWTTKQHMSGGGMAAAELCSSVLTQFPFPLTACKNNSFFLSQIHNLC